LKNASNAFTQTIRGTAPVLVSTPTSIIYDLPTTAPTAGQVLSAGLPSGSPLVSTLSWTTIAGGGNVVGPASSTTGNFAVYADTTGTLLANPTAATLLNGTITLGTSGTQGSLVINDGTTAYTTTLRTATNATASASYIFPTAIGSNTNVLAIQNAATGQLVWSATGTGDITKAGTNQVVTGDIRFQSTGAANVGLVLRNNAGTYATTFNMSGTGTAGTTYIPTVPAATGTVALLEASQSWSAAQTFQAGVTVSTGATTLSTAGSTTTAQLIFSGATNNWINFGTTGTAAPVLGVNRTVGEKVVVYASAAASLTDFAIGMASTTEMYFGTSSVTSGALNNTEVSFYNGTRKVGAFTNTGLVFTQTITGVSAQTGEAALGTQLTIAPGAANSYSTGSSIGYIRFWTSVSSAPSISNVRPNGTRIVLNPNIGVNSGDYAIGIDATNYETWITGGVTASTNGGIVGFWVGQGSAFKRTVWVAQNQLNLALSTVMLINGTQVVGARDTGYAAFTGTTNKATAYATGTVTLIQLAERVAAIQASLTTHGLIGA
jgi:hypothetical protein